MLNSRRGAIALGSLIALVAIGGGVALVRAHMTQRTSTVVGASPGIAHPGALSFQASVANPTFGAITQLPEGAMTQIVTGQVGSRTVGFRVVAHSNPANLAAQAWLKNAWGPAGALVTRPINGALGKWVRITDSGAYMKARGSQVGWPLLAVFVANQRILEIYRWRASLRRPTLPLLLVFNQFDLVSERSSLFLSEGPSSLSKLGRFSYLSAVIVCACV